MVYIELLRRRGKSVVHFGDVHVGELGASLVDGGSFFFPIPSPFFFHLPLKPSKEFKMQHFPLFILLLTANVSLQRAL